MCLSLKSFTAFILVLLFSLSASFSGPNQNRLRELSTQISNTYNTESSGMSPYEYVGSVFELSSVRYILGALPLQEDTVNLNELECFEGQDRVVNAEALAGLFIPVAEALLNINPIGVNESLEALRNARTVFESEAVLLPVVGEREEEESEGSDAESYSNQQAIGYSDSEMFFPMDDDDEEEGDGIPHWQDTYPNILSYLYREKAPLNY